VPEESGKRRVRPKRTRVPRIGGGWVVGEEIHLFNSVRGDLEKAKDN